MIRKLLLPAIAIATLAGCVTQPGYRDHGYGQGRVEYRRIDPYGAYGVYGYPRGFAYYGYGSPYYNSPYYGSPYYGYPYGGYRPPHPPRPPHGGDHDGHHGGDHDGGHHDDGQPGHSPPRDGRDRGPPWRNPRGMVERPRSDDRDPRQPPRAPPMRSQREPAPAPRVRSERAPSAMGGAVRRAESGAPRTSRGQGAR